MNGPARYLTDSISYHSDSDSENDIIDKCFVLTPHPLHLRGVVLPRLQS